MISTTKKWTIWGLSVSPSAYNNSCHLYSQFLVWLYFGPLMSWRLIKTIRHLIFLYSAWNILVQDFTAKCPAQICCNWGPIQSYHSIFMSIALWLITQPLFCIFRHLTPNHSYIKQHRLWFRQLGFNYIIYWNYSPDARGVYNTFIYLKTKIGQIGVVANTI